MTRCMLRLALAAFLVAPLAAHAAGGAEGVMRSAHNDISTYLRDKL